MIVLEELKSFFRGRMALNESLSRYTSFRIGGPADFYLEPADKEDVVNLLNYLQEKQTSYFIIGNGSNLLVDDTGIRGVVLNFEYGLNKLNNTGNTIYAESGVRMAKFVDYCIQLGRKGSEMLAGIPGTIGGAIIMNAGAYGGEISDHIVEVEVLRDRKIMQVTKTSASFSYRRSGLSRDVVLSGTFKLPEGDKAEMLKRRRELLVKRNQSQPLNYPNSGSMFKNPQGTFAAKLIEEAGLKGTAHGKAQISEKHGNFIVNTGGAKAGDVVELMKLAQTKVKEKFGILLEPEVKLVGFPERIYKELYR